MFDLSGSVALVTGGNGGVGLAYGKGLVKCGSRVALWGRNEEKNASAVEELESRNAGVQISRATTLLIDDDTKNIRYALKNQTRAIWFNPEKPHMLLQNIMKLV